MVHLPFLFPLCSRCVFRFSRVFRFRFRFVFHLLFRFRSCFHSGFRCRFRFHSAFRFPLQCLPQLETSGKRNAITDFFLRFRAQNTAFWPQNWNKQETRLCFPLSREFGGSWMFRLRIRSGPSKIRENTMCLLIVPGSELKTLRVGFRTGKNSKHTVF